MRTKEELLKDLGVNAEYNAHAGIPADTKEVVFAEILIDIRDQILDLKCMLTYLLDDDVKQCLIKAGLLET